VSNKYGTYKAWVGNGNDERKWTEVRKSEASVLDNELLVRFSKVRGKNVPVSGPATQEKTEQIHRSNEPLNEFQTFTPSERRTKFRRPRVSAIRCVSPCTRISRRQRNVWLNFTTKNCKTRRRGSFRNRRVRIAQVFHCRVRMCEKWQWRIIAETRCSHARVCVHDIVVLGNDVDHACGNGTNKPWNSFDEKRRLCENAGVMHTRKYGGVCAESRANIRPPTATSPLFRTPFSLSSTVRTVVSWVCAFAVRMTHAAIIFLSFWNGRERGRQLGAKQIACNSHRNPSPSESSRHGHS